MDCMSNTKKLRYIYDSVFAAEWPVSSAEILRKSIWMLLFELKIKNPKYTYFKLIFWPVLPSSLLKRLRKTIWTAVRVSTYVWRFDAQTTKRVCQFLIPTLITQKSLSINRRNHFSLSPNPVPWHSSFTVLNYN
jgi:hypothetical protein